MHRAEKMVLGEMCIRDRDYEILSELDFIFAKANLAKSYNGVAPVAYTHLDVYKIQKMLQSWICR